MFTGQQQRHEIGLRAAAGKYAVGAVRQVRAFGCPGDELLLDQRGPGALIPRIHRGIDGRGHHLGCRSARQHRAIQVRYVARVMKIDRRVQIERAQLV